MNRTSCVYILVRELHQFSVACVLNNRMNQTLLPCYFRQAVLLFSPPGDGGVFKAVHNRGFHLDRSTPSITMNVIISVFRLMSVLH